MLKIRSITWRAVLILLMVFAFSYHFTWSARAQDEGPQCPPGFVWQRMSGVGCVQEDCMSITNAKYSYTSSCICLDGYKGCYENVDYAGFDPEICGPNCPTSSLIACVAPDALCPGEEVPATAEATTDSEFMEDDPANPIENGDGDNESDSPADVSTVDDLTQELDAWLDSQGWEKPSAGSTAASAVSLSALLTAWLLNHLTMGGDLKDALKAINKWRRKDQLSTPSSKPVSNSGKPLLSGDADFPEVPDAGVERKPVTPTKPDNTSQSHFTNVEGAEKTAEKAATYAEEGAKALADSRKQFSALVDKIPDSIKKKDWWQKHVKPQLDKVNKWSDPTKIQEWSKWLQGELKVREDWYRDARHVPRKNTAIEGGIWIERGFRALSRAATNLYKRVVTDPAKTAVSKLPKWAANPANKAIDEQQKALENTGIGVTKVMRTGVRNITGGKQRHEQLDEMRQNNPKAYKDMQETLYIKTRPQDVPDFGRGLKKVQPLVDGVKRSYESFRSWLDKNGPVYFRRIPKPDH